MERDVADTLTLDLFESCSHRGQEPDPVKISKSKTRACPRCGQAGLGQKVGPANRKTQSYNWTMDTTTACQTIACWKGPLKDKGVDDLRQWLKLAEARLADVHRQMTELKDETKVVGEKGERRPGRQASLDIYFLRHRDQATLRWRLAGGKHATWELVVPLTRAMNASEAQAFKEWNARADVLNVLEQVARYEVRNVRRLMVGIAAKKELPQNK